MALGFTKELKDWVTDRIGELFDYMEVVAVGSGTVDVPVTNAEGEVVRHRTIPALRSSSIQAGDTALVLRRGKQLLAIGAVGPGGSTIAGFSVPWYKAGPATSEAFGTGTIFEGEPVSGLAVGHSARVKGVSPTAVGQFSHATNTFTTALGQFAQASEESATAVGQAAISRGKRSTAIGQGSFVNDDDTAEVKANRLRVERSQGSGKTELALRRPDGTWGVFEVTNSNGLKINGVDVGTVPGAHTHPISDITNLQTALDDKVSKSYTGTSQLQGGLSLAKSLTATNGALMGGGIILNGSTQGGDTLYINSPTITDAFGAPVWSGDTGLGVGNINGLQGALDDRVSKSATGTQQVAGSLQLAGSIGATGAIINGGIFNGDNDDAWPWGPLYLNSPVITDAFGVPQWDGDTGLDISHINGLQAALDGKSNTGHTHAASAITSGILAPARLGSGTPTANKILWGDGEWREAPSGTAPHTHPISDITNLQAALDDRVSKAYTGTSQLQGGLSLAKGLTLNGGGLMGGGIIMNGSTQGGDPLVLNSPTITDLFGAPQWTGDTGLGISNIDGLQAALNGKANTSHNHSASQITSGILAPARLGSGTPDSGKILWGDGAWREAPSGSAPHTHPISDITGLQSALDGKANTSHNHAASAITSGTLNEARIPSLAISKITNLQSSLDDKVSKSAGGTQSISGSLQLSGSIGATGAIINGGILNGDNNDTMPWGTFTINSPIITDVFGAPEWEGDTGLGISNINGLQAALNGKANSSHNHAASNITSGVLNPARVGSGTAAKNTVLHGDGTWKLQQIGVPVWGSQQWYGPITNGSPWKAETNLNGFPNNHFATWFVPPHDTSVDRASIHVVTAGGAGSVARIAIYADNNGEPGARVADFGSVLTDSTGTKTTSAISAVNLTGGTRYWAVVATSGTPVINGMTAWASLWGSAVNGNALCGITAVRANTNMPTNWNTGDTTFNHQVSPRVVFRTT